jgi:adenylate cyclase
MEEAIRLGPESWEVNKEAGRFFLICRDVPRATRHYEKAAEIMESDFHAWALLATCYRALGEEEKLRESAKMMVSEGQKAIQQDPSNGAALGILAGGYAILRDEERTREWIARALLIDPDNLNMRYNFACVLAAHLDDNEGALKLLQSTVPMCTLSLLKVVETDTDLDPLRHDPRFQKLLSDTKKKLGLEDEAAPAIMPNPAA